jgi:superkiller protein 3
MDQAIEMFRAALEESDGAPDIVCLLAQVLWAKGGEQQRGVARDQLFDCVEKHPGHIGAIPLLGVIAVLDGDQETIEAVTSDLQGLRATDDLDVQQQRKLGELVQPLLLSGTVLPVMRSTVSDDFCNAVSFQAARMDPAGGFHRRTISC